MANAFCLISINSRVAKYDPSSDRIRAEIKHDTG